MRAVVFVLVLFASAAGAQSNAAADASPGETPQQQAQRQAEIGQFDLHLNRLAEAQSNCDAALKLDPANHLAKDCLNKTASMLIDQDLNNADADLLSGNKSAAIALASKWVWTATDREQRLRAWSILYRGREFNISDAWNTFTPDWLRQVLVAIFILAGCWLLLLWARKIWRTSQESASLSGTRKADQRTKDYGRTAGKQNPPRWKMVPLKELPGAADAQTGEPTNLVLDAFGRLDQELARENSWRPKLLLLRPTPPADYEPAIITDFLSDSQPPIVLSPDIKQLSVDWRTPEVQLSTAVQSLQLKTATGIDVGSVARFLASIVAWFNAGEPTISGVSEKTDKAVSIHLAASGGSANMVAVTTSTDVAPGVDAMQLSADRAAFKFLYRLHNVDATIDEIDALSALRQGAGQFAQYAETVPGVGDNAATRTSSLQKAAFNFNFFRSSIPLHRKRIGGHAADQERGEDQTRPSNDNAATAAGVVDNSLSIPDELRQAVLLAEGVAHALIGSEHDRLARLTTENEKLSHSAQPAPGTVKDAPKSGDKADIKADSSTTGSSHNDSQKVDVGHAALAKQELTAAIDCFRQLQDWPGSAHRKRSAASAASGYLRDQAAYNEAIVWRQMRHIGRSVLMLTDLLGEKAKDLPAEPPAIEHGHALPPQGEAADGNPERSAAVSNKPAWKELLPNSISLPALLARLSAFAEYSRDDWTVLPQERANMLIEDGSTLVSDLLCRSNTGQPRNHDERLAQYMYIEALRALGHIQLLAVESGPGKGLCKQLATGHARSLSTQEIDALAKAIDWMSKCAQLAPTSGLYCDLAEAYLLYGDLKAAEGYARHATLSSNQDERASYLAAEVCFLESKRVEEEVKNNAEGSATTDSDELKQRAIKYAQDFKGTPALEEFKRLRQQLGLDDGEPKSASKPDEQKDSVASKTAGEKETRTAAV